MQKLRGRIFRRFWVKEPRHSENSFAKKRYTSIVARGKKKGIADETSTCPTVGAYTTKHVAETNNGNSDDFFWGYKRV